jgi:predicted DsbA family dithiol-disulfide isomerase
MYAYEVGLDQGAVKNMLNDDDFKDDVCESCQATTIKYRIHSIPFFIFNDP